MGTLVITPLAGGGLHRELLPAPNVSIGPNAALNDAQFDTDEEIAAEPDDAPIYRNGILRGYYNRKQTVRQRTQDEERRKFTLWFLRRCMEVAGRSSAMIPSHDKLGIATETWSKATDLIADVVEKKRGRNGGTRLVGEYSTLAELWLAVGEHRYIPHPSSKRVVVDGVVTTTPSPAPRSVEATD